MRYTLIEYPHKLIELYSRQEMVRFSTIQLIPFLKNDSDVV